MTNDLAFWLALDALKGVSTHRKVTLLESLSLSEVQNLATDSKVPGLTIKQCQTLVARDPSRLDLVERWLSQSDQHHLLTIEHPNYPPLLKAIADPPLLLFVAGEPSSLNRPAIAIVGSRNASQSGKAIAAEWAEELARAGIVVISGLAEGIDASAHLGALNSGTTIAVQGCGLSHCYPKRNINLRKRVVQSGAVVSAFTPEVGVRRHHFPMRNRIVSGLSLGVLVVEAAERSGSLITARLATEQGRDVFAVPGSIHDPNRAGCHRLIQAGAKLVTSPVDIVEEMLPQVNNLVITGGCENVQNLRGPSLLDSVDYEATPVDVIAERSQLPVKQVLEQLADMELDGWVESVPGGYIRLKKA